MLQFRGVAARAPRTPAGQGYGMGGEEGPAVLLLVPTSGAPSLPPQPSGPDLLPPASIPSPGRAHKGRRSPSPALPPPAPGAPPPPLPSLMELPRGCSPGSARLGAGGGGDTGTHGHRRGCGAAARGRPAPAPPRAARDVSPRRPLAPHALTLSVPPSLTAGAPSASRRGPSAAAADAHRPRSASPAHRLLPSPL